jgi:hypothetical protein
MWLRTRGLALPEIRLFMETPELPLPFELILYISEFLLCPGSRVKKLYSAIVFDVNTFVLTDCFHSFLRNGDFLSTLGGCSSSCWIFHEALYITKGCPSVAVAISKTWRREVDRWRREFRHRFAIMVSIWAFHGIESMDFIETKKQVQNTMRASFLHLPFPIFH